MFGTGVMTHKAEAEGLNGSKTLSIPARKSDRLPQHPRDQGMQGRQSKNRAAKSSKQGNKDCLGKRVNAGSDD